MALLSVKQAADQLGVSEEAIRRAIRLYLKNRAAGLKAMRYAYLPGRPYQIGESDLEAYRKSRVLS